MHLPCCLCCSCGGPAKRGPPAHHPDSDPWHAAKDPVSRQLHPSDYCDLKKLRRAHLAVASGMPVLTVAAAVVFGSQAAAKTQANTKCSFGVVKKCRGERVCPGAAGLCSAGSGLRKPLACLCSQLS